MFWGFPPGSFTPALTARLGSGSLIPYTNPMLISDWWYGGLSSNPFSLEIPSEFPEGCVFSREWTIEIYNMFLGFFSHKRFSLLHLNFPQKSYMQIVYWNPCFVTVLKWVKVDIHFYICIENYLCLSCKFGPKNRSNVPASL